MKNIIIILSLIVSGFVNSSVYISKIINKTDSPIYLDWSVPVQITKIKWLSGAPRTPNTNSFSLNSSKLTVASSVKISLNGAYIPNCLETYDLKNNISFYTDGTRATTFAILRKNGDAIELVTDASASGKFALWSSSIGGRVYNPLQDGKLNIETLVDNAGSGDHYYTLTIDQVSDELFFINKYGKRVASSAAFKITLSE